MTRLMNGTLFLLALAIALPAHADDRLPFDLPELGSQRRVVMAEMRAMGYRVLDASGDTMVFQGGPVSWKRPTQTTYFFRHNIAEEVRFDYSDMSKDPDADRMFRTVRSRVSRWSGTPWFSRDADTEMRKGSMRAMRTTWESPKFATVLESRHGANRGVTLSIRRSARLLARDEVEAIKGDTNPWDQQAEFAGLSTSAKEAVENLLDDLGEHPLVRDGAKRKGKPLHIKLGQLDLGKVAGVDATLVKRRFLQFVSGHWDMNSVEQSREADLEVNITLVPSMSGGKKIYTVELNAVAPNMEAVRGQRKQRRRGAKNGAVAGKTIYSAQHRVN